MKFLLLVIIKIYWLLIPKSKRRKCLFKTSCSNYVYGITKQQGLLSGIKALKFRMKNCNSKYHIIQLERKKILVTSTQSVFKEEEISSFILK